MDLLRNIGSGVLEIPAFLFTIMFKMGWCSVVFLGGLIVAIFLYVTERPQGVINRRRNEELYLQNSETKKLKRYEKRSC